MPATEPAARLRIDKWLWAARFFKARAVAAQAEMRKLAAGPAPGTRGRPSKKDRRQIRRFTGA